MIWNGFTLLIFLIVGITFFIGSRQPSDASSQLPGIIVNIFGIFDILLVISPLTLIITVLMSVFNVLRSGTRMQRFLPLTLSVILQGALTALLLSTITQPAA